MWQKLEFVRGEALKIQQQQQQQQQKKRKKNTDVEA